MPEITEYAPGTFCWIDMGSPDPEASKKFYTELFGWTYVDAPAGPDMVYTLFKLNGHDVCAMYQMQDDQKAQGIPPHWSSYVSVVSADETAAKAEELGGTLMMPPFDVMEAGRMAMIQDPTGAIVAGWQARADIGARIVNEPNSLCWNELVTSDHVKAAEFYTKLFGWTTKGPDSGAPIQYTEFFNGERAAGGMYEPPAEWGNVPSHWMPYISVADCDETAQKAQSLGAEIKAPPSDVPNVGRFATIQDPQGAVISIIKLNLPS